jgi:hypothetical protein
MKPNMGGIGNLQQVSQNSQMGNYASGPATGVQSPPGLAGVVKQAAEKGSVAMSPLDHDPSQYCKLQLSIF